MLLYKLVVLHSRLLLLSEYLSYHNCNQHSYITTADTPDRQNSLIDTSQFIQIGHLCQYHLKSTRIYNINSIHMNSMVLDIGTANSKIGYIGESEPRIRSESILLEADHPRTQEEDDLFGNRHLKPLSCNVDVWRSDITAHSLFDMHWQDETNHLGLLAYCPKKENYCRFIGQLVAEAREHQTYQGEQGLILIEPSHLLKHQLLQMRAFITQYVLEELQFASIYFLKSAVATCLGQGRATALVADSGHNFTTITKVHDGFQQTSATLNFAGSLLNHSIQRYLSGKGINLDIQLGRCKVFEELCRDKQLKNIKEQIFRPANPDIEDQNTIELELPDKQKISVERQDIKEPFTDYDTFKHVSQFRFPTNYRGLSVAIADSIEQSGKAISQVLAKSIILTGGNFANQALSFRTQTQLRESANTRGFPQVKFVQNQRKLESSWIGASLIGSLPTFSHYWVTGKEWRQSGMAVVHKKCP